MKRITSTLSLLIALSLTTQAQTILENNFDSITPGSYSGGTAVEDGVSPPSINGAPFGTSSLLGNASGNNSLTVSASNGVNGSASVSSNDTVLRSRSTADMTQTTTFSTYFYYVGSSNTNNGFVGLGWARADNRTNNDASGIDGQSPFNRSQKNRFEFGLRLTGVNTVNLATFGQFNTTTDLTGEPSDTVSATLATSVWYQLSGNITFNSSGISSSFDVGNITLRNWGADGTTDGTIVLSLASAEGINEFYGSNFYTDSNGYAYLSGNGGRGASIFDNVSVTAVPEPGTVSLLAGLFTLGFVALRRRRKN